MLGKNCRWFHFFSIHKKQQFSDHLSLYQREGLPVRIEYIDPQEDPTRAISENVTTADTVIVKLGEKEARLTSFTEEKISNAFVTLLKSKTKRIAFTKGHGERDLMSEDVEGIRLAIAELESERYEVEELNLLESPTVNESISLLAIVGPQYDFRPEEIEAISGYIKEGRPLLVL